MCKRCEDYADQKRNTAEDEPCPPGDHDFGEAEEWPADFWTDAMKEFHECRNCGWTVARIEEHEQEQIDESAGG